MRHIQFNRLVFVSFVISTVMATLFAVMAWHSAMKIEQIAAEESHARGVLAAASQVSFDLARLEVAYRGYAAYGTPDYLEKRNKSLHKLVQSVTEAEGIIPVPAHANLSHRLKRLSASYSDGAALSGARRSASGSGHAFSRQDDIVPLVEQSVQAYERMLEQENENLRQSGMKLVSQRNVEYASLVLLAIFLLLSIALFLVYARSARGHCICKRDSGHGNAGDKEKLDAGWDRPEFLAHVSHELRTTLNAIIGLSELLRGGHDGRLDASQESHVNSIHDCANHLRGLVNNILDLSRIDAGKLGLSPGPCNIPELCESTLSMIREKAAAQHIRLRLDIDHDLDSIHVYLDAGKVRQILLNFLSNAVKFTHDHGHIELCVRKVSRKEVGKLSGNWPFLNFPLRDGRSAEFLEFNVLDNGIGIAPDGLNRLFRAYSQVENTITRTREGTGLGLVLARRMAELLGGAVAMESAEGEGARFVVWLPLQREAAVANVSSGRPMESPIVALYRRGKGVAHFLAQQRTFLNA